jgi:hypothetical protein
MPAQVPIAICQGKDFAATFQLIDDNQFIIDVTGCTARLQFRRTVASQVILLEANSTNGKLQVGTTDGMLWLSLSASDTALLGASSCIYDVVLTFPNGQMLTAFEGMVRIQPAITR